MVVPSMAFAKSDVDEIFDNFLGQRTPQFMSTDDSGGSSPSTDVDYSDSDKETTVKKRKSTKCTTDRKLKRPRSDTEKKERRRAQNRAAAATSREKKKKHHNTMEAQMEQLITQNSDLQQQLQRLLTENERLRTQPSDTNSAPQNFSFTSSSFPIASTATTTTSTPTTTATSTATPMIIPSTPFETSNESPAGRFSPPMPMGISSKSNTLDSAEIQFPQQPEVMAMVLVALSLGFVVQAVLLPIMLLKLNMSRLRAFSRRTSRAQLSCTATPASKASVSTTFFSSASTPKLNLISAISDISGLRSWSSILPPAVWTPG